MSALIQRLEAIEERIALACQSCGRKREEVTLVAVSKTRTAEEINSLVNLGIIHFGENRLKEWQEKHAEASPEIQWHFIGNLQSNKGKKIGQNFHWVHSIDTLSAWAELGRAGTKNEAFVQVNLAREVQKSGVLPDALDRFLDSGLNLESVRARGLMTIGPQVSHPEESRPIFRELARLRDAYGLELLSMGMSEDFEIAIQEGATHIRVGSALFGPRS
jgi:pyridoxal phosphate enzyme (YggS family)